MKMNPVGWFEIYVNDIERARKFYQNVLELELESLDVDETEGLTLEMWSFPMNKEVPGAGGALVKMEGNSPSGNAIIVYFNCEDCAVEESRIIKAGGKIHKNKFSIGQYGYICLALDTEGNMFGLHSMK